MPCSAAACSARQKPADDGADGQALARIARGTGGRHFEATTATELEAVYRDIGRSVATVDEEQELAEWFVGAALALALLAGALSVAWFARLP